MAHPVITITRQYASGGAAVARQVAAALAWTVIDNEFVDEVARRAGLTPATVAEHEERAPELLERLRPPPPVASPPRVLARHRSGARGTGPGAAGAARPHARGRLARDVHRLRRGAARPARRSDDREADGADHRRGGGARPGGPGRAGRAGAPGAEPRGAARLRRRVEAVAHAARRGAPGRGPRPGRAGLGRYGPPARPVRADLLRPAPRRRPELRPRRQHREAGDRRRRRAGGGRGEIGRASCRERV